MSDWLSSLSYGLVRGACGIAGTFGLGLRVVGQSNLPRHGPVLVIANHQSFLDPALVGVAARRPLCYLARKTLFKNTLFGRAIRNLGAVPVDQEGVGKEGLKTILGELQKGEAVLIFPEGERCYDGQLHPLRPGVQLLIKRAQAPVVPVGIAGAFDAWPRTRPLPTLAPLVLPPGQSTVAVAVGRPLDGRRYARLPKAALLAELFAELQKVVDQAEWVRHKIIRGPQAAEGKRPDA